MADRLDINIKIIVGNLIGGINHSRNVDANETGHIEGNNDTQEHDTTGDRHYDIGHSRVLHCGDRIADVIDHHAAHISRALRHLRRNRLHFRQIEG